MADDFDRWLRKLDDAFVVSTAASLDIKEALAITKRRVATQPRAEHHDTNESPKRILDVRKGQDAAGATRSSDNVAPLPATVANSAAYMDHAYTTVTAQNPIASSRRPLTEEEFLKRRRLLAHGAAVMFGTAMLGADRGQWLPSPAPTPAPSHIDMSDVKQVEAATRAMRALDYQFGGGACRNAVLAQLSWAQSLLGANCTQEVRQRLCRALGDLQSLAGWTSLDIGSLDASRDHFSTALELAKQANESSLMANVIYRIGRIYMHYRDANEALKWFQLGQIAAIDSGSELDVSLICRNEAWAYAMMGDEAQAMKLLGRSRTELARADLNEAPDWARFYTSTDMLAMIGTVHDELSHYGLRHHGPVAISALELATTRYDETMNRSQALTLTTLATAHLREDDVDRGIRVARKALRTACNVKSKLVSDQMKPLEIEAARRSKNADSRKLAHSIREYRNTYEAA